MDTQSAFSFRKGDIYAIVLVILLALAVFGAFLPDSHAAQQAMVQVYQDAVLIHEIPLNQNTRLEISGEYTNIVVIGDGQAYIESSDCPGNDCVHSGRISHSGRSIACLPNRVELRISGADDTANVDFVVG